MTAIRFIRCVAPVPGSSTRAGGAAFTLNEALAKCRSEMIERSFEINELRPNGIKPVGIAAHKTFAQAYARAAQEAIETLCIQKIHSDKIMRCRFFLKFFGFTIGLARTEGGYFCLMRGKLSDQFFAAHSAATTLIGAVLKTWEEYASFHFFKPAGKEFRTFSKANTLFSANELSLLQFQLNSKFTYRPELSSLTVSTAERAGRKMVYFHEKLNKRREKA